MEREMTCIICPVGCALTAIKDGEQVEVRGASCRRGVAYATEELTAPKRVLCSSVRVEGGVAPLCAVRTSAAIPRERLLEGMAALRALHAVAPLLRGDVLEGNFLGLGVQLIVTRGVAADGVAV